MQVRVEIVSKDKKEEIVVYCHKLTPQLENIIRQLEQHKTELALEFFKGGQQYYLSLQEILFFETEEKQVYAHTRDAAYQVRQRLYELENLLPAYFVRVSRFSIANTLQVFSIQRNLTRVNLISFRNSHKEIYASRSYSAELLRKMNERYRYESI